MERKLVAISLKNGKCNGLYIVKNVDDREFNKLLNEFVANLDREKEEKEQALNNQVKRFCDLEKKASKHDFLLAKNIYDNFVDRGLIEDNDEFQKLFYDIIFNKAEIDLEKAPQDYLTILEYVRGK